MSKVVVYHAKCIDGCGGAAASYLALGDTATYIPVLHHYDLPDVCYGAICYFIDIILSKEQMRRAEQVCEEVIVLDHHETAFRRLDGVKVSDKSVLNMEKSGCMLAWEFFHPYKKVPLILWHLQDYDLWKFDMTDSESIAAYMMGCVPFTHTAYAEYLLKDDLQTEIMIGKILHIKTEAEIESICSHAGHFTFEGHHIMAVNSPIHQSQVGNYLVENNDIDFAVVWYHDANSWEYRYSMRGKGKVNLAELAESYEGGGHPNSSGFRGEYGPLEIFCKRNI